jgi:hypothetical protein
LTGGPYESLGPYSVTPDSNTILVASVFDNFFTHDDPLNPCTPNKCVIRYLDGSADGDIENNFIDVNSGNLEIKTKDNINGIESGDYMRTGGPHKFFIRCDNMDS